MSGGASPPIGVGLPTGVRETTVPLPPGTVACLYTDGLVEARAGDGMLGRARLEAMVEALEPDEDALALLERVVAEAHEAPDDMTACLLRPVSEAKALSPRIELLDVDREDIESGLTRRFLEACGVPTGELAVAVDQVRVAVESDGRALVEVTIAERVGRVRVGAAGISAPPTAV